jgi:hypothetical protein
LTALAEKGVDLFDPPNNINKGRFGKLREALNSI